MFYIMSIFWPSVRSLTSTEDLCFVNLLQVMVELEVLEPVGSYQGPVTQKSHNIPNILCTSLVLRTIFLKLFCRPQVPQWGCSGRKTRKRCQKTFSLFHNTYKKNAVWLYLYTWTELERLLNNSLSL